MAPTNNSINWYKGKIIKTLKNTIKNSLLIYSLYFNKSIMGLETNTDKLPVIEKTKKTKNNWVLFLVLNKLWSFFNLIIISLLLTF